MNNNYNNNKVINALLLLSTLIPNSLGRKIMLYKDKIEQEWSLLLLLLERSIEMLNQNSESLWWLSRSCLTECPQLTSRQHVYSVTTTATTPV